MKYIKLIIVLLVLAGAIAGITYIITRDEINDPVIIKEPDIKLSKIEKRIQDEIESASNSSFCADAYDDILNSIKYLFREEPSNRSTYTLKLQGAYCRKFVQQANYVFDGNKWEDKKIEIIKTELKNCKSFFPDDEDLKTIENVLDQYYSLKKYDDKVRKACNKKPLCLDSVQGHLFLYQLDDWDVSTTKELLESIPSGSGKVKNSPVYKGTRLDKVQSRLKKAHYNFIHDKMERSKIEVEKYNYNPAREQDYANLKKFLGTCFDSYMKLWPNSLGDVQVWITELREWNKYILPKDPTQ